MKKIVLGVVLVVLLVGSVVLLQAGRMHAKTAHDTLIEELENNGNLELVEERLDRGWLSSSSDFRFRVVPNAAMLRSGAPSVGFQVHNAIDHGPVPMFGWLSSGFGGTPVVAQVDTRLEFDSETARELFGDVAAQVPPLTMQTVVRASGVGETTVQIPAQRFEKDGFSLDWKGLNGTFVFDQDGERVAGQVTAPGFEGGGQGASFSASDLEWTLDYDTHASGLLLGKTQLTLSALHFGQAAAMPPIFAARKWEFWQDTSAQGDQVNVTVGQRIAELEVMGQFYGPGELELRARKLDAPTLIQLRDMRDRLQAAGEPAMAAAAESVAVLQKLMAHSPEVEISKLSMVTPSGEVRGSASLVVDGSQPELLGNPMTLPMAVTAEVEADLPAPIFGDLVESYAEKQLASQLMAGQLHVGENPGDTLAYLRDRTIANLRRLGFVVFDGERYRSKAKWAKGQFTVNGMPVDPMQGLGDAMGTGGGLSFPSQPNPGLPVDGFPASLR